MLPAIGAHLLTGAIEIGPWPEAIADEAFQIGVQVGTGQQTRGIVRDKATQVPQQQRNPVDDRVFTLTLRIGAVQDALEDLILLLVRDLGDAQRGPGTICVAARGAERAERFEMMEPQGPQPPIRTVGQPGGMI